MLRLNAISQKVFEAEGVSEEKIKFNGEKTVSKKDVVATGRLVACEYFGNLYNKRPDATEKYQSKLNGSKITYSDLAKKHKEKKLLFCAAMAARQIGMDAPKTFDEFKKNHMMYANNATFLQTMAAIDVEVLSPIIYDIMDSVGMGLMQWESSELGRTKEITIFSNDVFLYEDLAPGTGKNVDRQYLYSKTITMTPQKFGANVAIKWYQDIVNGDAGRYYAAIMNGMYNKIYAILMEEVKNATSNQQYIPSGLTAQTYTSANWISITDKLAAVNGVSVGDLMAVGTRSALSQIVPMDSTGGAILGFQYGLGEEWFKNGYLANVGGVDLLPVAPIIVPGTQNSTMLTIDLGTNIYILAKGGAGYKPMYGVYAEGTPILINAYPDGNGALGTADYTIAINVNAFFDIKPVFASKVAVISSVYPQA